MTPYKWYLLCVCMFGFLVALAVAGFHNPFTHALMGAYFVLGCIYAFEAIKEERENDDTEREEQE